MTEEISSAGFVPVSLSDELPPKRNDDGATRLQDAEVRKDRLPKILGRLKATGENPRELLSLRSHKPAAF